MLGPAPIEHVVERKETAQLLIYLTHSSVRMNQHALRISENEGTIIENVSADRAGAAALRLMIERGMITDQAVMNGRFFHACARELEFDSSSPEMQFIRDNWYKIQRVNSDYYFEDSALDANLGKS